MSDDEPIEEETIAAKEVGAMLRMIVHDVRNPIATLLANLEVLADIDPNDPEVPEIIADLRTATSELDGGMKRIGWLGQHLAEGRSIDRAESDVMASLKTLPNVVIEGPEAPLLAKGGGHAAEIAAVLIDCAMRYGRSASVKVEEHDEGVIVSVSDPGTPVMPTERSQLFGLQKQLQAKRDPSLRYARFLGLPAVAAAVADLGGRVWADEKEGRSVLAFLLPRG